MREAHKFTKRRFLDNFTYNPKRTYFAGHVSVIASEQENIIIFLHTEPTILVRILNILVFNFL